MWENVSCWSIVVGTQPVICCKWLIIELNSIPRWLFCLLCRWFVSQFWGHLRLRFGCVSVTFRSHFGLVSVLWSDEFRLMKWVDVSGCCIAVRLVSTFGHSSLSDISGFNPLELHAPYHSTPVSRSPHRDSSGFPGILQHYFGFSIIFLLAN